MSEKRYPVRELTKDAWKFFGGIVDGVRQTIHDTANSIVEQGEQRLGAPDPADVDPLPDKTYVPWMDKADDYMGLREIRGRRSNKTIMGWARSVGVRSMYGNDDVPWCGLYVAGMLNEAGIKHGLKNPLGARQWLKFGKRVKPCYGAVIVFWRGKKSGWTGHVGFLVSEDKNYYHVLGGNQSNSVNVTKISKHRLLGCTWPSEHMDLHESVVKNVGKSGRVWKRFDGKVSVNEQ